MIKPAANYAVEIEQLYNERLYDPSSFFYIGNEENYPIVLSNNEERSGKYNWAVLDNEKVIGYISYWIDWTTRCASSFGMYCFDEGNLVFGLAIRDVMKMLIEEYRLHRIEWRMISGNPVQKHYDKFCEKYGGNRVVLHDVCKDRYGKFHDEYIYEIIQ